MRKLIARSAVLIYIVSTFFFYNAYAQKAQTAGADLDSSADRSTGAKGVSHGSWCDVYQYFLSVYGNTDGGTQEITRILRRRTADPGRSYRS